MGMQCPERWHFLQADWQQAEVVLATADTNDTEYVHSQTCPSFPALICHWEAVCVPTLLEHVRILLSSCLRDAFAH